jgi:electron transfer flavoprotein beta subunit
VLNIIVLLKQTFDTEEKISIRDGKVIEEGMAFVVNPYDEYALEEALKLKESQGATVTAVTAGPERAEAVLRTALALGVDQAVLIDTESLDGDEHTVAQLLTAFVRQRGFDLILAGNTSVDNGAGQVALRLAEELDIPHVSSAVRLTIEGSKATAVRDVEGNSEIVEASLPLLVTAQQGLNEPRYPSLPGIMKAKKKPIERLGAEDLGLSPEELKAKTVIVDQFLPPGKAPGKILSGELSEQVKQLAHLLRHEAKVI